MLQITIIRAETICPTSTSLSFTEREACYFNDMSVMLVEFTGNNVAFNIGSRGTTPQQQLSYGVIGDNPNSFLGNLEKAKSLLLEKTSNDYSVSTDLLLTDSEIRKQIMQIEKISIENQTIINEITNKREF